MELERGKGRSYFSVSSVKLYRKCPKCYALRYVLDLKQPTIPERVHFGSAVHAGLAALYNNQSPKPAFNEALAKNFGKVRMDDGRPASQRAMCFEGEKMLDMYEQKRYFFGDVVSVEARETVRIRHPFTGEVLETPMMLQMDVVFSDGIIDHKVKANPFDRGDAEQAPQKTAYWMAFEELYGREPSFFAFNQLLRRKGMPRVEPPMRFTEVPAGEKARFFDTAKDVLARVAAGEFPRGETRWHEYQECESIRL